MTTCLYPSVQEVEGNVERVDVRVIRVVHKDTPSLSLLHLQTHGNRFQRRHTLSQLFRCHSKIQRCGGAGDTVLYRGLITEGNIESPVLALIAEGYGLSFYRLHIHRHLFVALRPRNLLALVLHPTDTATHNIVVRTVNHRLCVVHQLEFLHTLLLHRTEVLLMSRTQ